MDRVLCDLQILSQLRRDRLMAISKIVRNKALLDRQMVDEINKEIIKSSNLLILYPIEGPEVECES